MPCRNSAIERADHRTVAGEAQAVADAPTAASTRNGRRKRLRHGGEHVLLAHHAAIEQRQARDGHHQHQAGRRDHPGGIGAVDLGRRGGCLRERRRCRQRHQHRNAVAARIGARRDSCSWCPPGILTFESLTARRRRSRRCGCARRDRSVVTKILPSPIWPVLAAAADRLHHLVDSVASSTRDLDARPWAGSSRRIRRRDRFPCGPSAGRSL